MLVGRELNSNQLTGQLPTQLGTLSAGHHTILDLNDMSLSGTVPTQIGGLRQPG